MVVNCVNLANVPYLSSIECGKYHKSLGGEGEEKCNYLDKGEVTGGSICAPASLLASHREGNRGID